PAGRDRPLRQLRAKLFRAPAAAPHPRDEGPGRAAQRGLEALLLHEAEASVREDARHALFLHATGGHDSGRVMGEAPERHTRAPRLPATAKPCCADVPRDAVGETQGAATLRRSGRGAREARARAGLEALNDRRDALAEANAHRGQAVALAGALQLVDELRHEGRAGRAQGVAVRDGAAVHVDLLEVDAAVLRP